MKTVDTSSLRSSQTNFTTEESDFVKNLRNTHCA